MKKERKKKARKHLKGRILWSISLILTFSMILSTLIGYLYFNQVVRKQRVEEEKNRLVQIASQIAFQAEDNRRFAQSILVDEQLQYLLEEQVKGSEFRRQSQYDKVTKRLVFYNSLRTYLEGSILQMADGSFFGSSYSAMDTAYLEQKLQQKELQEYTEKEDWVYSNPYYDSDSGTDKRRICYAIPMYDKRNYGHLKATLYLEMNLEYFLTQVKAYAETQDCVALIGNDGEILYQQDKENVLRDAMKEKELDRENIYHTSAGYLICTPAKGTGWKLCTIITNADLLKNSSFVLKFFVLSFLLSVGLVLHVVSRILENMVRPVTELSEQMERTEYGKQQPIQIVHTGDEIETLYECFQDMMTELYKGEQERIAYEKQKRDMEYDITLSQINPHYIYNVLNTVVYLSAAGKNQDVVKIVHSLIATLHETLKVGDGNVETTIEKELELTKCYLDIQRYRYPDVFQVEVMCEDDLKDCLVPKTMIQPLVENAILHGILPTEESGKIWIIIQKQEEKLCVMVKDEGIGIKKEQLKRFEQGDPMAENKTRKHIGVENVRDRIRYLYGEGFGMEIQSTEGKGTSVILTLPVKRAEEKKG